MKFTHLSIIIAALADFPKQSTALKCGINGITEPCIGETDVRYDPDVSYNIKEQEDIWGKFEGLYVQDSCEYDADGTKRTEYLPPTGWSPAYGTYNNCNEKGFLNITVDGARYYYHKTVILKHNGDDVYNMTLPGFVLPVDSYGVSTFEKNGEIKLFMTSVGYLGSTQPGLGEGLVPFEPPARLTPVGGRSLLALTPQESGDLYESTYCPDLECTKINSYIENYSSLGSVTGKSGADVTFFFKDSWYQGRQGHMDARME